MNTEESAGSPVGTAEPQASGAEPQGRHRHRGRRGRYRRGGRGRDSRPEREPRAEGGESGGEQSTAAPEEGSGRKSGISSIRRATEQVLHVRAELRRVLDEIQEILRFLDQAEREKTATEDEIEMLRESLRGLHREPGYNRHRGGPQPRPAPAPSKAEEHEPEESDLDEEEEEAERDSDSDSEEKD